MSNASTTTDRTPDYSAPAHVEHLRLGTNLLVYIRSSSDKQELSPGQQAAEVSRAFTSWELLDDEEKIPATHSPASGVYADQGVSGWKHDIEERPGSAELLEYCEANPQPEDSPGLIVVWSLARLGRFADGSHDAIYWVQRFKRCGWRVRSLTQKDLDSNDGDRLGSVLRLAVESEKDTAASEERSAEVKRANQEQLEAGTWRGGTAPFGYQRVAGRLEEGGFKELETLEPGKRNGYARAVTSLKPDPAEKHHVIRAFELYAHGDEEGQEMSLAAIARQLNEAGVYPERAGGQGFRHNTVKKLLRNDVYLGIQRDEQDDDHEALWEPIVPRDLWYQVQQQLKANGRRRGKQNSAYMLSGVLFCADCDRRYHGSTDTEYELFYYRTKQTAHASEPCETCRKRVRIEDIELPLMDMLSEIHTHPEVQRAVQAEREALEAGGDNRLSRRRAELEAELQETDEQIDRFLERATSGGRVGEKAEEKVEELNRRYERLTVELGEVERTLQGEGAASAFVETVAGLRELLDAASGGERKKLVQALVARIELDQTQETACVHMRKPGR